MTRELVVVVFKHPVSSTVEYVLGFVKSASSNASYIPVLKLPLRQSDSESGICFSKSLHCVEAFITSGTGVGVGVGSVDVQLIAMIA